MKIFKRTFIYVLSILIISIIVFISNGLIEKIFVDKDIKSFIDRGEYVTTIDNTSYFKVVASEDEDGKNVFDINDIHQYIGTTGDIIVTNRNPLRYSKSLILKTIVGIFSKSMFIGHGTYNVTDDGAVLVEIDYSSSDKENNVVKYNQNTWVTDDDGSPYIIGLRAKKINDNIKSKLLEYAKDNIGKKYNISFIYNKNKFYCTDLVSRAYKYSGIKINYDSLFTTGNDMIVSDETYIIFVRVKERGKEDKYKIYYLDEE